MGANVSSMIDSLIDAKVQKVVTDQRSILARLEKETAKSEKVRILFVEERGIKITNDLVASTDPEVATLAAKVLENISTTEDNIKTMQNELDLNDVILQLKAYPREYQLSSLRLISNLANNDRMQQSILELGIFSPLVDLAVSKDLEIRVASLRVWQNITENTAVARIAVQRNLLTMFIKQANHVNETVKARAMGVLANLCKTADLKSVLIKHGVILQFVVGYLESQSVEVRFECMRGFRRFSEIFVDLSNLRYLTSDDIEFVTRQIKMQFPAVLGKPNMDISAKFLSRQSVAESFDRLESLAISVTECEVAALWLHDDIEKVMWTWDKRSVSDLTRDLLEKNLFKVPDTLGPVSETFQAGRPEVINVVENDEKLLQYKEKGIEIFRPCDITMRNMLFVPLQDRYNSQYYGILQLINKISVDSAEAELEDTVDDDDDDFFLTEEVEEVKEEPVIFGADAIKNAKVVADKIAMLVPIIMDKQSMINRNQKILEQKSRQDQQRYAQSSFELNVAKLANTDVRTVLKTIIATAQSTLRCDAGSFYMYNQEQKMLWGVMQDGVRDFRMSSERGIAGLVAREGRVLIIRDCYKHPMFNKSFDIKNNYRTKTMLLTPVKSQSRVDLETGEHGAVIGVIQMINKYGSEFNKNDMQRLDELKTIVLPILEAKMRELEMELYERRTQTVDALKTLCDAVEVSTMPLVQAEAVFAVASIANNNINHKSLLNHGITDAMIRIARPNVASRVLENASNKVNRIDLLDVKYQNSPQVILRIKSIEFLACMASNHEIQDDLVRKGVHSVFLLYVSDVVDSLRFQALRGLANIASCRLCHGRLLSNDVVDEMSLHISSNLMDDVILTLRFISQLAIERKNLPIMFSLGMWDIVWDYIREIDTSRPPKDKDELDAITFALSATSYFCRLPAVRSLFLNERRPRTLLDYVWKTRAPKSLSLVIRHFVYILEDRECHDLFIETGGIGWLEKGLIYVKEWRSDHQGMRIDNWVQLTWNFVAEAIVELAKRPKSMDALLDLDILTHIKIMCDSRNIDLLYSVCRVFQIMGSDEVNRTRMVEMGIAKKLANITSLQDEEIVFEALMALKVIIEPLDNNRQYTKNLDTVVDEIGPYLTRIMRRPSIDEPNFRLASVAGDCVVRLCRSPYCRTQMIQTGIVPDLIYQSRSVEEDDPRFKFPTWFKSQVEEMLIILDDAFKKDGDFDDDYDEDAELEHML